MAPALPRLRLVVAEDNPSVRLFLREALENTLGHHVLAEATGGNQMVQTVLEYQPDLVVFDIHLPQFSGLQALRQIHLVKPIAAVAITADRDEALMQQAVRDHVLAYLIKPVGAQQLGPAILVAWARFQELGELTRENTSLRESLENRKIVERAKGVLMRRFRWGEAEAYRRLQRGAMNRRLTMPELAQGILNGTPFSLEQD